MPGGRLATELVLVFPASLLSKVEGTSWPVAGGQKGLQTLTNHWADYTSFDHHSNSASKMLCGKSLHCTITVLEPFLGECFSPQCLKMGSLFHSKKGKDWSKLWVEWASCRVFSFPLGPALHSLSRLREQRGHLKPLFFFLVLIAVCFLPADPGLCCSVYPSQKCT